MSDGMTSVALDAAPRSASGFVLGVAPGVIVAGFDVHRRQITFDAVDTVTGEVWRGQIESSSPSVEEWVGRFGGRVLHVAVEACTGWLFVCRALERCGAVPHLAADRDERVERTQAPREDRSRGREMAAGTAARGPATGVMDAARARAAMALTRPAAQHAGQRAHRLGATDPRDALSPRGSAAHRTICAASPAASSSPAWRCPSTPVNGSVSRGS